MITLSIPSAGTQLRVPPGTRLIDALRGARVSMYAPCGGRGVCGKCRAVLEGSASPPSDLELEVLSKEELEAGIRLACQTVLTGDAAVRALERSLGPLTAGEWDVPPKHSPTPAASVPESDQDSAAQLGSSFARGIVRPRVETRTVLVDLQSPDGEPSDWERVAAALGIDVSSPPALSIVRRIPLVLRAPRGLDDPLSTTDRDAAAEQLSRAYAVLLDRAVMDVLDHETRVFGVALDIGTTTIVAYLVNLATGETVDIETALNPQTAYGADVVSRISFASSADGLDTLRRELVGAVNDLIRTLADRCRVDREQICLAGAVGNTCMHHIFLGIPPGGLAHSPYKPVVRRCDLLAPDEVGLGEVMNERGRFFFLPNVAGFVGSDALAVAVACGMSERSSPTLAIDLGTNGEIILAGRGRILACSAAAGPAFEGVNVSCGMIAAPGAIDAVRLRQHAKTVDISFHVIGGGRPLGICGSGLVSLVAALRRAGLVDESGAFVSDREDVPPALRSRLVEGPEGLEFIISAAYSGRDALASCRGARVVGASDAGVSDAGEAADVAAGDAADAAGARRRSAVRLTQRDIRELQLAKGAIAAGVEILVGELGIRPDEITRVCLAGAFGTRLDKDAAAAIGLLPPCPGAHVTSVGNAAGEGAVLTLMSADSYREALRLAHTIEHVELGKHAKFHEVFAKSMALGVR